MAKVPNHAHCVNCDKAIAPGEEVCSTACGKQIEENEQQRKRMLYLMYGLFALGFILLVVVPFFQQGGF